MKSLKLLCLIASLALMVNLNVYGKNFINVEFMDTVQTKTVLFITGAFVSNSGWDEWKDYFEQRGFITFAPAWPCKEGTAEELRNKHPDSKLAVLTLQEVVDFYADFAGKLPEKPYIVGHSMGGLITQLLIQRGVGLSGVAYHSVPPKGVMSFKYSFLKSLTPPLGLFKSAKVPYMMSFKHWQYSFTNGMDLEYQKATYEAITIPESRTAIRQALSKTAKIDFKKPHAPLLFVSGTKDHIMPSSLNRKNFKRYKDKGSITEYKEFEGRNHLAASQPGWEKDADYIISWLKKTGVKNTVAVSQY